MFYLIAALSHVLIEPRVREGRPWAWADDAVSGTWSNVPTEDVHPAVLARRELDENGAARPALVLTTLAGPTCDSLDIVGRDLPLPVLAEDDLLVSPAMGACTTVAGLALAGATTAPRVRAKEARAVLPATVEQDNL